MLGPDQASTAEQRGAAMSAATAAEYLLLVTTSAQPAGPPEPGQLSARERELVSLAARSARTWTGSGTRPAAAAAPT